MRLARFSLALALAATAACKRDTSLPPLDSAAKGRLGEACTADRLCASKFCVDGVCCAARCGVTEICDAPASKGQCVQRPLGAPCSGAGQCPTGFCVDGVCCSAACDGLCQYCAAGGSAGTCLGAADNTNPRGDCGHCQACFGGFCLPALAGTDPDRHCGGSLVCAGDGSCGTPGGGSCDAAAPPCASGACTGGVCMASDFELLRAGEMNPAANERYLLASSIDVDGALSAVFVEHQVVLVPGSNPGDPPSEVNVEDDLFFAHRDPAGWHATNLTPFFGWDRDYGLAALAGVGHFTLLAGYSAQSENRFCEDADGNPARCCLFLENAACGLYGQWIGPGGATAGQEILDPAALFVDYVSAAAHGDELAVLYDSSEDDGAGGTRHRVHLLTRTLGSAWSPTALGVDIEDDGANDNFAGGDLAFVGGKPFSVFVYSSRPDGSGNQSYELKSFSGATSDDAIPLPAGCRPKRPRLAVLSGPAGGSDKAALAFICELGSFQTSAHQAIYDPAAPAGTRWAVSDVSLTEFRPTSVAAAVLPGGAPALAAVNDFGFTDKVGLLWNDGDWKSRTVSKQSLQLLGPSDLLRGVGWQGYPALLWSIVPFADDNPRRGEIAVVRFHP